MDNDIKQILSYIDCSRCTYLEWATVGMILKKEGYSVTDWEDWSRTDSRYHPGECDRKWATFKGASFGNDVGIGTLVHWAKQNGYEPRPAGSKEFLSFDSIINIEEPPKYLDTHYISAEQINIPGSTWNPVKENIEYLEALFEPEEYVGFVTTANGKTPLGKGIYTMTAGQLIDKLRRTTDITNAYGSYNTESGAWIHINPLDGKGVTDANVTAFRFCLIESDEGDKTLDEQYAVFKASELPIAALTWSGGKSLHAVVRVDAKSMTEYQKKVNFIYETLSKNDIKVDQATRNPSRLTRFPGFTRGDDKQFLVATNIGAKTFEEWKDNIQRKVSDLPPIKKLSDVWYNPPPVNEPLIEGLLRRKHKMLISAASKAGKSFSLIELSICLAEGREWLGFQCHDGKVLHIDFELDESSLIQRIMEVCNRLGISEPPDNFNYWALKGKAKPLDKLVQDILRECKGQNYVAVVIDPIYKVMTGDENSATDMANFCNQFDILTTQLDVSVIFSHHHSKGAQSAKRAQDRASGSGVFARDPDALIDMTELDVDEDVFGKIRLKFTPKVPDKATGIQYEPGEEAVRRYREMKAFRLEFILREFRSPRPMNIWWDYPCHVEDEFGFLEDADLYDPSVKAIKTQQKNSEQLNEQIPKKIIEAIENIEILYPGEQVTYELIGDVIDRKLSTVKTWIKKAENDEEFASKFEVVRSDGGTQKTFIRRK